MDHGRVSSWAHVSPRYATEQDCVDNLKEGRQEAGPMLACRGAVSTHMRSSRSTPTNVTCTSSRVHGGAARVSRPSTCTAPPPSAGRARGTQCRCARTAARQHAHESEHCERRGNAGDSGRAPAARAARARGLDGCALLERRSGVARDAGGPAAQRAKLQRAESAAAAVVRMTSTPSTRDCKHVDKATSVLPAALNKQPLSHLNACK